VSPPLPLGEEREEGGGHNYNEGPYTVVLWLCVCTLGPHHPLNRRRVCPPLLEGSKRERGWGLQLRRGPDTVDCGTLGIYMYFVNNYMGSVTKTTFASIFNILYNLCWLICRANKDKKLLTCGAK
jgi:hypothetical protein